MMKEKMTYEEMIGLLQQTEHQADDRWESLNDELMLEASIEGLAEHEVEKDLWAGIEAELPQAAEPGRVKKLNIYGLIRSAAIFLALLSIGGYAIHRATSDPYTYKSEIEISQTPPASPEQDLVAIEKAKKFIQENHFLFSDQLIQDFMNELAEIEEAISEIETMQAAYGAEESDMKLLSKMERQKAAIIKSMINRQ